MKNLNDLTVVIVTYQTPEKIIFDCLKSIDSDVKILIIENSENFIHEQNILSNFSNVRIKCSGENLGYGNGNNFGLKEVQTNYALILNPDVVCEKSFFNNIINVINKAEDFSIIGCQYLNDKTFMPAGFFDKKLNEKFRENFRYNKINDLHKVEWVTGCSLLINLKKFEDKEIFDKNFFLYFEEIDLCKSIMKSGGIIYTSNKLRVHHLGFKSSLETISNKRSNLENIREWHWMWSSFYFYKKNYSYFFAFYKMFGKLIKSFLKLIFYLLTFQTNKREKYQYRFFGIISSMIGRTSFFRIKK